jgi:hypothetical protein
MLHTLPPQQSMLEAHAPPLGVQLPPPLLQSATCQIHVVLAHTVGWAGPLSVPVRTRSEWSASLDHPPPPSRFSVEYAAPRGGNADLSRR